MAARSSGGAAAASGVGGTARGSGGAAAASGVGGLGGSARGSGGAAAASGVGGLGGSARGSGGSAAAFGASSARRASDDLVATGRDRLIDEGPREEVRAESARQALRLQPQPQQRPRSIDASDKSGEEEPLEGFRFSFLCFSGVDDSVSPRTLCDISQEFSFVEWGVNFRAEKQGKEPRYASLAWLRQLREEIDRRQQTGKFAPIHFAAHLGGEYCVDVMKGDASLVRTLWEDYGFLRIQLSPTRANGVNSAQLRKYLASLKSVIIALPQVEFVLEVTKETRGLSFALMDEPQPNLAFLFTSDAPAEGSGDAATRRPPLCPHPGIHVGYGGSLTVDNLRSELRRIAATVKDPKRPVWVDLESGLRSQGPGKHDEFDLGKVWACIRTIFDLKLPRPRLSPAAQ